MATIREKIQKVIRDPAMLSAYLCWLTGKLVNRTGPKLEVVPRVRLSEWISFSEYWSFHEGLPENERQFLQRCLEQARGDAVAFDVGANIGLFTCALAKLGAKKVHAFEPIPKTFCRLEQNVNGNGLIQSCVLNCLAVGRDKGLVSFWVRASSPATNKLAYPTEADSGRADCSLRHIATTSLDTYCEAFGIERIDFLKIDAEGMEPWVLQGSQNLFSQKRIGAALIEICPQNLAAVGSSLTSLAEEVARTGYNLYRLDNSGHPGLPLGLKNLQEIMLENVALIPP